MAFLRMTMIDVGWGDSILLEADDKQEVPHYALIDSNDTANYPSSRIFLKRYFEKESYDISSPGNLFDFVILTHNHSDHGQGLKAVMKTFGTDDFWYSKSHKGGTLLDLMKYARRSSNVGNQEAINASKSLPRFGQAEMKVLWPKKDQINHDENENSIVLQLTLNNVSFVLTGDAEETAWDEIADQLPGNMKVFKIPHHGSKNGFFNRNGNPNWLNKLKKRTVMGISSHVVPFSHPDDEVITGLENAGFLTGKKCFRTDQHYHISFETNGNAGKKINVKYWH